MQVGFVQVKGVIVRLDCNRKAILPDWTPTSRNTTRQSTMSAIENAAIMQRQTALGILLLMAGLAVFSLQDVIMKLFSSQIALQQVIFFRGLVTMTLVGALLALQNGARAFVTNRLGLCLLRGVAGFVCFTTFSMALAVLPLAEAMPLYYTSPLFVIMLAVPLLGETVRARSWLAVLFGFAGVLLIARPTTLGVDPAMILALCAALAYSAQSLLARKLGATESALTMTFYSQIAFVVLSGVTALLFGQGRLDVVPHPSFQYLFRAWSVPSTEQAFLIVVLGLIGTVGFLCISQAYRLGPASRIAPFEYSSLPFAVFWGWLIWSDVPTVPIMFGSLLIVGSGLFAFHIALATDRRSARPGAAE